MSNIESSIQEHLDATTSKEDRIAAIDDLLHMLNFERRLADLSDEEAAAMMAAGEPSISTEMRARIDRAKSQAERDELINGYARAQYFRQCAWASYLNGVDKTKPFVSAAPSLNKPAFASAH